MVSQDTNQVKKFAMQEIVVEVVDSRKQKCRTFPLQDNNGKLWVMCSLLFF